jgi:cytochrome b pre-mRNA-processing protein 3
MTTKPPQRTQLKSLNHMPLKRSWLTRKVEESPVWRAFFFKLTDILGYGSPKQMAGRRSFVLYDKVCAAKPDEDREFWQDGELNTSFGPEVILYL